MALLETGDRGPVGRPVFDRDGRKLGKLERVYGEGDRVVWGAVKRRFFGRSHMVPLRDAQVDGEGIRLAASKPQVEGAPSAHEGAALPAEVEDRLRRHYSGPTGGVAGRADEPASAGRRRTMAVPRTRGAMSGALLLLLGLWGGFSPLVGPYFGYAFGQDDAWNTTTDMLWLNFLPAAAVVVGALVLISSANRAGAGVGAWLALVGGIWFVIGPTFSLLWDGGGPGAPIGRPLGDEGLRATELIWSFYGLGAVITALAAFALGRLATVSVRDVRAAEERQRA
jgi:hypothetical protein